MKPIKWRMYYDADKTVDDCECLPQETPGWGVMAIGQPHAGDRVNPVLYDGLAYLYRIDWDCWMQVHDEYGLADNLVHFAHVISAVRFGRTVRNDVFRKAKREVEEAAGIRRSD